MMDLPLLIHDINESLGIGEELHARNQALEYLQVLQCAHASD
jgi:hypothetical protein